MKLMLNQRVVEPRLPAGAAAVDYIRREAGLTGTKVACREGDCGACTVLLGELGRGEVAYRAVNSCLLPLGKAAGRGPLSDLTGYCFSICADRTR